MKNLSRAPFLLGILTVLLAAFAIATSHLGFALQLVNYTFGLFLIGVIFYIWKLKRNEQ